MIRRVLLAAAALSPGAVSLPASPLFAEAPVQRLQPYAAPDRELMLEVPGGRVYVRINGPDHGRIDAGRTPAIFIHGGPGGTHAGFLETIALAQDRPVILYDQLDSGRSDHPGNPDNWKLERFVEALETIRTTLGIERWHVVGHSWGSAIALRYSAEHGERIASTVLGGTFISTPLWIEDANRLIEDLPEEVQQTLAACESANPPMPEDCTEATGEFYARFNRRMPPSAAAETYKREHGGRGFNPALYNAMWGPSEFRATGSLRDYDDTALLGDIEGARTLFLIGQHDEARIATVEDFVKAAPGSELAVVPGAAHGFFSDRPYETQTLLAGWFARHD